MDAKLVVVGGEARVAEVQLQLPATIGRGRNAGLTLPHPLVSRQHCELYEEDGKLVVNDLGSLNGTFVGDQRISEPTFLMPGELLTVGTVTFRAVYELADDESAENQASTGTELEPGKIASGVEIRGPSDADDVDEVEFAEPEPEPEPEDAEIEEVEVAEVEDLSADDVEEVEDVEEIEEVEEVEEIDFEDVEAVEEGETEPQPKPKPKLAKTSPETAKAGSANHDTQEVSPVEEADNDGDDDDLQAFLKGLG